MCEKKAPTLTNMTVLQKLVTMEATTMIQKKTVCVSGPASRG